MDDLEALPPDPDTDTSEPVTAPVRRGRSGRVKVLMAAAGVVSVTLAGFVAGVALTGNRPAIQLADTAAATGTTAGGPACTAPLKSRGAGGTVATVDSKGTGFTLTARSTTVTVKVDGATTYEVLTTGGVTDLSSGAPVVVRADRKSAAGAATNALQILIVPAPAGSAGTAKRQPPVGTITATSLNNGTGTVTVTTPSGAKTVNVTSSTKIFKIVSGAFSDLAPGQSVTVVGAPPSTPTPTAITAARVVINKAGGKAPFGPFAALTPTLRGGGCAAGRAPSKRGGAAGTVANLNGSTFSITSPGGTVKVITSGATVFTKQVQEAVSGLKPGTQIAVRGMPSTDGKSIAASQIAIPAGASPMTAPAGPAGRARGLAVGTVTANDPSTGTLTIKKADGSSLNVTTTPKVIVSATVPATIGDLHDGDVALVTGTPDATGTITATRVVIGAPGQPPFGGGRFPGGSLGGGSFGGGPFGGGPIGGGPFGGGPFGGPRRGAIGPNGPTG
jgi:hypothetical protein